ncbi:unnamed protein product [Vicia faba]|uniref:Uncharacterized protein n=1 Tax=Vicia faba TaxID=3906 RepID=A0AAV1AM21_VICFA|nr:unnamed protein product [Vicia faba]
MFPKIDQVFVKTNMADLTKTWTIMNNEGVHHTIVFNKNLDHPVIVSGWKVLESYYNLPPDMVVAFAYYGNDNFSISSIKELNAFEELPKFHNRFLKREGIIFCDVDLTPQNVDHTKLVELFKKKLR